MNCFICRDTATILYHICTCNDSVICLDCYNNELTSQMEKCGICRKPYIFNRKRDWSLFLKLVLPKFGFYFGLFLLDILPPLIIFLIENSKIYNYLFFIGACILISNVITLYILKKLFDNNVNFNEFLKFFYVIKYGFILFILVYLFIDKKVDKLQLYSICVGGFVYILPLIMISIILLTDKLNKFIKLINQNTIKKQIKINQILYN